MATLLSFCPFYDWFMGDTFVSNFKLELLEKNVS